jgi:hypothetical protein
MTAKEQEIIAKTEISGQIIATNFDHAIELSGGIGKF